MMNKNERLHKSISTAVGAAAASVMLALPLQADYPSTILESGPVAYFPLDEGAEATTVTSLVSGLNGDVFGEPTRVAGPRGDGTTAFMFNNPEGTVDNNFGPEPVDYIRVPTDPVLDITGSVSLELWLNRVPGEGGRVENRISWEGFAGKNDNAYQLRRNSSGSADVGHDRIAWSVNYQDESRLPGDLGPSVIAGSTVSSVNIDFGNWMHVVGVVDLGAGKQMIYINGVLDAEVDLPADRESVNVNAFDFMIGAHLSNQGVVQRGTVGALAEVAVYDHALSPERVLVHYQTMVSGDVNLWNGLVVTTDAQGLPWVDSPLLGSIVVEHSPWIWVHSSQSWLYLPEHDKEGSWAFAPSGGQ